MGTRNISERSFYRIKKVNIAEGTENNENTYRLRKNTKYDKINEFTIKYIDDCNKFSIPLSINFIKAAALQYVIKKNLIMFKAFYGWYFKLVGISRGLTWVARELLVRHNLPIIKLQVTFKDCSNTLLKITRYGICSMNCENLTRKAN